jgi:hypothetical protein
MQAPLQAALPLLPALAPPDPAAPGPFAFADLSRVRSILADSGYGSVTINPFDANIGGEDLDQTLKLALRIGPLGRALREHPEFVGNVTDAVRDVLSKYLTSNGSECPPPSGSLWPVLAERGDFEDQLIN